MSGRQKYAKLYLRDFPLVDQFTFLGPHDTPAVHAVVIAASLQARPAGW